MGRKTGMVRGAVELIRTRPLGAAAALFAVAVLSASLTLVKQTSAQQPDETPAPSPTAAAVESDEDAIVLNFEAADIREVVHSLASALGISYLIDPRVEGQVTIRTSGKIPRSDLFPIFNQILRSNGISAVKIGEVYHIIPIAEAKTRAIVRRDVSTSRADDLFVIELVPVKNIAAQEMATLLQPFITPGGDVIPYVRANLLIITDLDSNVDRLREMISLLDRDSFKDLKARIYKIKNADIQDLGQELISVLDSYGITGEAAQERGVYAIPLIRLNSVAVLAFNPDMFRAVEYWLKLLDVPPDEASSRTVRVYNVQNAKAGDLAQVLNELYGGGTSGGPGGLGGQPGQPGAGGAFGRGGSTGLGSSGRTLGGGGSTGLGGGSSFGGGSLGGGRSLSSSASTSSFGGGSLGSSGGTLGGGSSFGGGSSLGNRGTSGSARPAGVLGGAPGSQPGGGGGAFTLPGGQGTLSLFQAEVHIVADEVTNSIVILATKRDYEQILTVLKELDVVPRQVLIEVLIAEISLNKGMSLGLQSTITNPGALSNAIIVTPTPSGTATPTVTSSAGLLGSLDTIAAGALGDATTTMLKRQLSVGPDGSFTALITDLSTFKFQLNALASAGRAKVLASPQILTADNREASIHIGTQIPVLTSQANIAGINNANGSTALVNNIQYRDTGVILTVLPQVNAEGLVNLEVHQEVSDIGAASFGSTGSPSFISRQTETTAVVQNGDTLMIGGIIQESTQRNRSGIPYVMDIPVIGRLFRVDTDTVMRTELMILLTPHVVRNREEGQQLTDEYKARLKDVVHEIERTRGLSKPTPEEEYEIRRERSRATTAEKPRMGQLPNRDTEE